VSRLDARYDKERGHFLLVIFAEIMCRIPSVKLRQRRGRRLRQALEPPDHQEQALGIIVIRSGVNLIKLYVSRPRIECIV